MKTHFPSLRTAIVFATLVAALAPVHAQKQPDSVARLDTLRQSPESAGALVYRGETFTQRPGDTVPLFRYERRVIATTNGLVATHLTSTAQGELTIVESAQVSPDYALQRLDIENRQTAHSGSAQVSANGKQIQYRLIKNGKSSSATEDVSDPVVSGTSMFGFILKNRDVLQAGKVMPVRMIVLSEKTTYGFDIALESRANGQTTFSVVPTHFLIRMAIAPMHVVFDDANQSAVRYVGRVPPMQMISGKLKDLDARVEYTNTAARYR
ncbi:MAG: hypothetical protein RLZZ573_1183 [Pseudomonadota bacterium]